MKTQPNPMPVNPKCMYCGESVIWEHSIYPDCSGWKHVSPALWHCGIYKSADVDLSQHEKETCIHCGREICQKQSNSGDGSWVWKHEDGWQACDGGIAYCSKHFNQENKNFSGAIGEPKPHKAEPASNVMPKTVVTKTQTVTYTVQVNDKLSVPENKGRKFRTA